MECRACSAHLSLSIITSVTCGNGICAGLHRIVRPMMFAAIWLPHKIQISYNFRPKAS
jgi:hypothetical protein